MTFLILTLLLLATMIPMAEEPVPAKTPARTKQAPSGLSGDSAALVKASNDAKAAKKQGTKRKVITNKDLKHNSTKLKTTVLAPLAPPPAETIPPPKETGLVQLAEERYRARKAAELRVAAAEKHVIELEANLGRIEQNYYDENDLNERDTVIRERFAQARRQLTAGRRDLADARDTLMLLAAKP